MCIFISVVCEKKTAGVRFGEIRDFNTCPKGQGIVLHELSLKNFMYLGTRLSLCFEDREQTKIPCCLLSHPLQLRLKIFFQQLLQIMSPTDSSSRRHSTAVNM